MGQPGGLPSVGPHRVGGDWRGLAAAAAVTVDRARWGPGVTSNSLSLLFLFIQECETSASPLIPVLSSQPEQGNRRKAGVSVVTGGDSRDTLESQRTSLALLLISASTMHLGLVSATTPHPQSSVSYPRHLALPPRPGQPAFGVGRGEEPAFLTVSLLSKGQGQGQQQIAESDASEGCCCCCCQVAQSCPTLCDPLDGRQPTGLPCPWDSPGKNTGVGFRGLDWFKFCCF